jgi:uncharacterized membrane protein YdjX (TVP38/TMEM64 family)
VRQTWCCAKANEQSSKIAGADEMDVRAGIRIATPLMRLVWLTLALALAVIVPFVIWGGRFDQWLTLEGTVGTVRSWGALGWLGIVALLVGDLILPIPATPVMSAAGYLYGWFAGGLLAAAGSFLAGTTAYLLCRNLGHRAAERLVGHADLEKGHTLFVRRGPWLVALSRALPVLPEVIACLAGLTGMPVRPFFLSLACGSLPLGFVYAAIGAAGTERPALALGLSALIPAGLWLVARRIWRVEG